MVRLFLEGSKEYTMSNQQRELTQEEIEGGYIPASEVESYNPDRYDFKWNHDYSGFIPMKMKYWDDTSYAAYQASDECGGNWEEIQSENESDHRETMENEKCGVCGNTLINHYNHNNAWVPCKQLVCQEDDIF